MTTGKDIATNGYRMEKIVTDWFNGTGFQGYGGNTGAWPEAETHGYQIKATISEYIETTYGSKVIDARHVGNQIHGGCYEVTGKDSPADIVLDIQDFGWLGVSLKYAATYNSKSRTKVYCPTPMGVAEKLDEYGLKFDSDFIRDCSFVTEGMINNKMEDMHDILRQNKALLEHIFGEFPEPISKKQRSHIRKIIRREIPINPDYYEMVVQFYNRLRGASSDTNKALAKEFYMRASLIGQSYANGGPDLLRYFANVDRDYLDTITVDARPKSPWQCDVAIYRLEDDINRYIADHSEGIPLNKRYGTCTFRFGPLNIEANTRAGSRSEGGINVTIDKKHLRNVIEEDKTKSDFNGQAQSLTE